MSFLDYAIVVLLNGSVIALGVWLARGTQTSSEWFLGARSLPWWAVGMSMFATNVDNADLVAVTGSTYNEGLHIVTVYALGSALGGIAAAFLVVPAIYRQGFYTNAEYLEARFGTTARVLSACIQLQYRSSMLGLMIVSVHLLLTRLVGLTSAQAWGVLVATVILAGLYTAWGGLKSVVWTDAMQGIIMLVGAAVIFNAVWQAAGGWSGMEAALAAESPDLVDMTHIGRYHGDSGTIPAVMVAIGWTIVACGYWTVNHTQTMRLMGTRSLWDMKMAAVFGVAASLPVMVGCACLGVFGRALPAFHDLQAADTLYPLMANEYLASGLKGLVVAGVVAAAVSTFDSMGSALSAVFTRDIYARLIARDRSDAHYVKVGRIATVSVLGLGFAYLPFILMQQNMLRAFTTLIPVFVTPLFTMYLIGVSTAAHRRSGLIGLVIGSSYGFLALIDREFFDMAWLPKWLTDRWMAFSWSFLITAGTMWLATLWLGRERDLDLSTYRESGWLDRSREQLPQLREHPFADSVPTWLNPTWWAVALLIASTWIVFGLLW